MLYLRNIMLKEWKKNANKQYSVREGGCYIIFSGCWEMIPHWHCVYSLLHGTCLVGRNQAGPSLPKGPWKPEIVQMQFCHSIKSRWPPCWIYFQIIIWLNMNDWYLLNRVEYEIWSDFLLFSLQNVSLKWLTLTYQWVILARWYVSCGGLQHGINDNVFIIVCERRHTPIFPVGGSMAIER